MWVGVSRRWVHDRKQAPMEEEGGEKGRGRLKCMGEADMCKGGQMYEAACAHPRLALASQG